MIESIKKAVSHFKSLQGEIRILTSSNTDGITSGSILAKALQREDRNFRISVINQLDKGSIEGVLKENPPAIFLVDLGSNIAGHFKDSASQVFIFDHHEIAGEIPKNAMIINSKLFDGSQNTGTAALVYLFAKELDERNSDFASLAVIGIISDLKEKDSEIGKSILKDAKDITIKRSILFFPATRPLHKALEFSSVIFIPGVTGSSEGSINLLKEAGIELKKEEGYRTLLDLSEEENSKLLSLISLRRNDLEKSIGEIYLVKFFNQLEDARELSVLINGCGRMDAGGIALEMCIGNKKAKLNAESIYNVYKHNLISGLKLLVSSSKIEGENYMIIDAGSKIKDTLIGPVLTIMASSFVYPTGKILIGLADSEGKTVKVSARACGNNSDADLHLLIGSIAKQLDGESRGDKNSASCIIKKEMEKEFISLMQKELDSQQKSVQVH